MESLETYARDLEDFQLSGIVKVVRQYARLLPGVVFEMMNVSKSANENQNGPAVILSTVHGAKPALVRRPHFGSMVSAYGYTGVFCIAQKNPGLGQGAGSTTGSTSTPISPPPFHGPKSCWPLHSETKSTSRMWDSPEPSASSVFPLISKAFSPPDGKRASNTMSRPRFVDLQGLTPLYGTVHRILQQLSTFYPSLLAKDSSRWGTGFVPVTGRGLLPRSMGRNT